MPLPVIIAFVSRALIEHDLLDELEARRDACRGIHTLRSLRMFQLAVWKLRCRPLMVARETALGDSALKPGKRDVIFSVVEMINPEAPFRAVLRGEEE